LKVGKILVTGNTAFSRPRTYPHDAQYETARNSTQFFGSIEQSWSKTSKRPSWTKTSRSARSRPDQDNGYFKVLVKILVKRRTSTAPDCRAIPIHVVARSTARPPTSQFPSKRGAVFYRKGTLHLLQAGPGPRAFVKTDVWKRFTSGRKAYFQRASKG